MDKRDACTLVNEHVTYKPGWDLYAVPAAGDGIWVAYVLRASNSSPVEVDPRPEVRTEGEFYVALTDLSPRDVQARVLRGIIDVAETHEAREFFRVNGFAPFHPHRRDGDIAWRASDRGVSPVTV